MNDSLILAIAGKTMLGFLTTALIFGAFYIIYQWRKAIEAIAEEYGTKFWLMPLKVCGYVISIIPLCCTAALMWALIRIPLSKFGA